MHVAEAFGGGLLEMVRLVAEGAVPHGHRTAIAYGRRPETPADTRSAVSPPVELFDLEWHRDSAPSQAGVVRRLRSLVRQWRPDVVHLHSSYAGAVGLLAMRLPMPVVYTPHAWASAMRSGPTRALYAAVERRLTRRADLVGAVSESEAAIARSFDPSARVAVIPNGILELDVPRILAGAPRPARQRPLVVAMGRMVGQRRPHACARILSAIADVADVEWIGGGGDQGAAGEAARAALESAGVPLTGWLDRADAIERLRAATAYLHWTTWDGQPLSVMEAMSQGAVVVASDIAPNRELLDPSQLASTEEEAVQLLRRVLGDPTFHAARAADQRRRSLVHSADRMVDTWLEVYEELAQARPAERRTDGGAPVPRPVTAGFRD